MLVVDDDPDVRDAVETALELEGHSVMTATDGLAALKRLGQAEFDAVVLDVLMPNLDGFEMTVQRGKETLRIDSGQVGVPLLDVGLNLRGAPVVKVVADDVIGAQRWPSALPPRRRAKSRPRGWRRRCIAHPMPPVLLTWTVIRSVPSTA